METDLNFEISFPNCSEREADKFARELAEFIGKQAPEAKVERESEHAASQDLGSILTVIVSSTAMTAVAIGIQNWLSQRTKGSVTISKEGEVVAENIDSSDAVKIVELVTTSKR